MLRKHGIWTYGLLVGFVLSIPRPSVAQWATSGNNINNTNSGNVGVGTTTPNAELDVTTTAGNDGISIHGNNNNGPALKIKNSVANGHEYEFISNGPINNGGVGALQLWDNTDLVTRMVILPTSGNVGIGTLTPNALLDVTTTAGNDGISIHGNNNNGPALKIKNSVTGGHEYEFISNGSVNQGGLGAFQLWDNTDSAARMVILPTSGNIGVGTTTPGQRLEVSGSIKLSAGSGGGFIFADGTSQTTATLQGPSGPQGPTGATGPQGPQGAQGPPGPQITTTYRAFCAGPFGANDSVVLNPLGQSQFPNCFLIYNGFTVRYVPEFGNGSQSGDFPIYIDSPTNTTVDTQYGFAVPRAGTLANLRASAITHGSTTASGKVLVRKIHTDNTIDNTSSDILLTCTVGTGTSCSDTTHTLSISAGERIIITVQTSSSETLASISVLVDLQ